jgi:hypothetical protein
MTAKGRWFIGPHAVQRFRERSPLRGITYEQALSFLISESESALFIGRTHSGLEMWRGQAPLRMRYIVGPGNGPLPAVRTVHRPHARSHVSLVDGVVVHSLDGVSSTHACAICGVPFIPREVDGVTCGRPKCRRSLDYAKERNDEAKMQARRERARQWYAANRERHLANVAARRAQKAA